MRFSFYAALAAAATAVSVQSDEDAYADYLWAQHDAGDISTEEMMQLAENYAEDHFGYAETDAQPEAHAEVDAQPHAQPIMTDLKWLGGKIANGARAVGRGIDAAYDATKAGIKKAGSAVINAPGNMVKAGDNWLKKHNFKAQTESGGVAATLAAGVKKAAEKAKALKGK